MTLFLDMRGSIPMELALLIKQSVPVELTDLNSRGLADTFWLDARGESWTYEIKQAGEIMLSLGDLEEQMSHQQPNVDHLGLLVAGVIVPCHDSVTNKDGCKTLGWSADGRAGYLAGPRGGGVYHMDYGGYRAKLRAWEDWGITVTELPTKLALARHIVACYNRDQKPEVDRKTFRVPIRAKHSLPTWDAYTLSVMSLYDPASGKTFCGPDRAQALMDRFGNPYSLFSAEAKEIATVAGIGPKTAQAVLRSVGRGE